jgi:hypothetical protein
LIAENGEKTKISVDSIYNIIENYPPEKKAEIKKDWERIATGENAEEFREAWTICEAVMKNNHDREILIFGKAAEPIMHSQTVKNYLSERENNSIYLK